MTELIVVVSGPHWTLEMHFEPPWSLQAERFAVTDAEGAEHRFPHYARFYAEV